jgi:quinol monooxygenase YgiN
LDLIITKNVHITKQINLTAKENCEDALLAVLKNMVALSQIEKVCLRYELYQLKDSLYSFFFGNVEKQR